MPLPAALQARLKQRGLLKIENEANKSSAKNKTEEVFAESYDKPSESKTSSDNESDSEASSGVLKIADCPNRSNPYHECTAYCRKRYGVKKFEPSSLIEKRRLRMLKAYPLPPDWIEVPDFNTNRYYYWNPVTDQVSWLSPSYSRAKVEDAKVKLQETKMDVVTSLNKSEEEEDDEENSENEENDDADESDEEEDDDDEEQEQADNNDEDEEEEEEEDEEDIDELLTSYEKNESKLDASNASSNKNKNTNSKTQSTKRNFPNKRTPLHNDPMDPSSYSNCPKGKWSAGLEGE